jgi:calcium-dependent protein kinase
MTCEDEVIFDKQTWQNYSNESKDLINRLLIKNPEKRITLDEVINHPWFRKIKTKIETKLQLHPPRKSPMNNMTL